MQIKPDPCTEEHFFQLMSCSTLYTDICFNCKNYFSDNNTYQAAPGIVDNLLHGILQFRLTFLSNGSNLVSDPVLHKLFNRLAENIGLPDTSLPCPRFPWIYRIRSSACCSVPTIGAISVSIFALIMWTEGLFDRIFTPNLFPWRITEGSSIWISSSSAQRRRIRFPLPIPEQASLYIFFSNLRQLFHCMDQIIFALHGNTAEFA